MMWIWAVVKMRNIVLLDFLILLLCRFSQFGLPAIVEFEKQPGNYNSTSQPFDLVCRTSVSPPNGLDYVAYYPNLSVPEIRLCEIIDWRNGKARCIDGYSISIPDNRTAILHINPAHPNFTWLAESYCCQYDNGQGPKSCGNRTDASEGTLASTSTVPESDVTTGCNVLPGSFAVWKIVVIVFVPLMVFGIGIGIFCCNKNRNCNCQPSQARSSVPYRDPQSANEKITIHETG